MSFWSDIRFFKPNDFDSPDIIDSYTNMKESIVRFVDKLRFRINRPLFANSAYRSENHNKKVGGSRSSSHLRGHAIDVRSFSSAERFELVKNAIELGIARIGIADTFIHFDDDPNKPQNVLWIYPKRSLKARVKALFKREDVDR